MENTQHYQITRNSENDTFILTLGDSTNAQIFTFAPKDFLGLIEGAMAVTHEHRENALLKWDGKL